VERLFAYLIQRHGENMNVLPTHLTRTRVLLRQTRRGHLNQAGKDTAMWVHLSCSIGALWISSEVVVWLLGNLLARIVIRS
jgi:hypothetical protein